MPSTAQPSRRPARPLFSSGPCAKRPGWDPSVLADALLGRSHRAGESATRIRNVIELSRRILGLPQGYRLGVVPGSDTGAVEMALWSLLGARGVHFRSFGGLLSLPRCTRWLSVSCHPGLDFGAGLGSPAALREGVRYISNP